MTENEKLEAVNKSLQGERLLQDGEYEAALAALTEAIRLDPEIGSAYLHRAQTYRYSGRHQEADRDVRRYWAIVNSRNRATVWLGNVRCWLKLHSGNWQYTTPGECDLVRICRRCNAKHERTEVHESGEWIHATDTSCLMREKCLRCAALFGSKTAFHDYPNGSNHCRRCGHIDDLPSY